MVNIEESNDDQKFPIVGIGSSAGGLEALEKFFKNMPPDSDMAFILVTHLDPDRKSILTEIITSFTKMKVEMIEDNVKIEKNHTYIIPPNSNLTIKQDHLFLSEPEAPRGFRLPINFFFRSLAEERKELAICIILSGTGTDGTMGLREIKGAGGMVVVQDPKSAEYDGMPRSAIKTGMVDFILPPEEIPRKLISYTIQFLTSKQKSIIKPKLGIQDYLPEIFTLLYSQIGHDFSKYKVNTLIRRIEKRMTVVNISSIEEYIKYIKEHRDEPQKLFQEFLIGVTRFFRDKEAIKIIRDDIIPKIIKNTSKNQTIRIWVPACSTGEDAYSIAILLYDYLDKRNLKYKIQIFGTDIDENAIDTARQGIYSNGVSIDIPAEYIKNYFDKENKKFKIKKKIRNLIVFAVQNIISDPPFSKLDLICCRNLLIYLKSEIQKEILLLFYYSLNKNGYLFLGSSETISGFSSFYSVVDSKWKIFQKIESVGSMKQRLKSFPKITKNNVELKMGNVKDNLENINVENIIKKFLINEYTPSAVIINKDLDIIYFHGRTGKYLEPSEGSANFNIVDMAKKGYRLELKSAIRQADSEKKEVIIKNIKLDSNGKVIVFNLKIIPYYDINLMGNLAIVIFEDIPQEKLKDENIEIIESTNGYSSKKIKELQEVLDLTKARLQSTIEELETSNEELKSTNEELQSANEELQSTNEELETSKEELQSVNEELLTVNSELEAKIRELTDINNDLANLVGTTEIGTIFLDMDLKIRRFTPFCIQIFNLVENDIDRPLHHITHNLKYESLIKDVKNVKENLVPIQKDVEDNNNSWYSMRIFPYRTFDNIIDGVTIIFFDITDRKKMEQELTKSEEKYKEAYNLANFYKDIFVHDMNNILQSIISSIEYFALTHDKSENGNTKYIGNISEIIKKQVKRGSELISNVVKIFDIMESESNLFPIRIKNMLEKVVKDQKTSFQEKNIEIDINGLTDEIIVLGDDMLNIVFENIINNCIKHNYDENKIRIDIEINKIEKEGIDYIKFEFKDYGIGINDAKKQTIFMRKHLKYSSQKNMGIGLSLVQKLIKKYNGEIQVENRIEKDYTQGSNFIILLRAAEI